MASSQPALYNRNLSLIYIGLPLNLPYIIETIYF